MLHLLDDLDSEEVGQAVVDGLCGKVAEQQSRGSFVRSGFEDGAVGVKDAEFLGQFV